MPMENSARYWQSAARRLAQFVNLGWWLESWLTWVVSAGLAGAVAILLVRWMEGVELRWVWAALGGVLVTGALVAWGTVRRKFESEEASRIRLEDAMGLKTRLTAAAQGVGPWPEPAEKITWPVRWRWQPPVITVGLVAALLALAAWVPIEARAASKKRTIEKPSAVKDVEQWIEEMRHKDAAEDESLKELEKKIAELLERPAENWYEHGSLEAAGNLKEQTSEMLRELSENLADAERAASALRAAGDAFPQEAKEAIGGELANAAQGLRTGGIKPGEQLLKQLQQASNGQGQNGMGNLSKEQLEQLAQMLRDNAKALAEALANSPELKLSQCAGGNGEGEGDGPGKGGIKRGPGTAPLSFKKDETNLDTKKLETLNSQLDLNRIAPGDVMGVQDGKHDVDENAYTGSKQGGTIQNAGDGGAAVWQNSLLPGEREALKRYFK
ncbi:hypothetical protein [Verrucomicrobium spinosum]|uniref:hypothetical protein n=1 Tax=Verrucomicrobium spinosum TaxID=2736 RepID=UPI0012F66D4E|nr:hypothetical protein [Verrucomicrobium spinosum]